MQKLAKSVCWILLASCLLSACGEVVPIYSKIQKVPELTLHFADQPVEFNIE